MIGNHRIPLVSPHFRSFFLVVFFFLKKLLLVLVIITCNYTLIINIQYSKFSFIYQQSLDVALACILLPMLLCYYYIVRLHFFHHVNTHLGQDSCEGWCDCTWNNLQDVHVPLWIKNQVIMWFKVFLFMPFVVLDHTGYELH